MEVPFTTATETQIKQFAASTGKDAGQLVVETMSRVLERRAQFLEGIQRGIAAADNGELVDDHDVRTWLEQQERR